MSKLSRLEQEKIKLTNQMTIAVVAGKRLKIIALGLRISMLDKEIKKLKNER